MSEIATRVAELSQRVDDLKVPPHSMEAEQSVLGGLMLDNESWEKIADLVNEKDFYRHDHALIFRAIAALSEDDKPYDVVTIKDWLENRNELDSIGGLAYLGLLANETPTAVNVKAYAEIVREYSVLRKLIKVGHDITNAAYNSDGRTSKELVDEAERLVFQIAEQSAGENEGFEDIKSLLSKAVKKVEELFGSDEAITGISSGFTKFDEMTSGLQRSDLIIVAGRPSMGKCIVSGSRLVDPDSGRMLTIDEMVANEYGSVTALDNNFNLVRAQASAFVDDGIKPVFEVKTALGRRIQTTLTHPFLTGKGWCKLEDIAVGERVAIPRELPVFGSEKLSEHEVKALAYFLTDGGTTQASPLFTNVNKTIVHDFINTIKCFNAVKVNRVNFDHRAPSYRVSGRANNPISVRGQFADYLNRSMQRLNITGQALAARLSMQASTISYWRNAVAVPNPHGYESLCSVLGQQFNDETQSLYEAGSGRVNSVTEFLKAHDVWNRLAHMKSMPSIVFRLPKERMALFLNRLFACDGSISISKTGQVRVSYGTASESLARDVQHLLLRFGIIAKLRSKDHHQRRQYEVEVLCRTGIERFISQIGMIGKEAAIDQARSVLSDRRVHSNRDSLPESVIDYVLNLKAGDSWPEIFARKGLDCPAGYNPHLTGRSRRLLTRERAQFFADLFDDRYLAHLASSDLYWDEIVSIEFKGNKQVYDLTVPELHNFVAEDICVHNTTFAMNMAEYAAVSGEHSVAVFSMEMPGEQLAMRMMSSLGRINQHNLRTGKLDDHDWPRLTSSVAMLSKAKLFIDDSAALSPTELRARCRRLKREHGLDLIVIDYLQLMQISGGSENRATEISEISRSLKALAKELHVPVIALSQLNRSVEQRPDKRPVMSDLRESGGIEQDADVILFIYRDEVYNPDSPDKGTAEILIRKQRNGPIGGVRLSFLGQFTRFENLAFDDYGLDE